MECEFAEDYTRRGVSISRGVDKGLSKKERRIVIENILLSSFISKPLLASYPPDALGVRVAKDSDSSEKHNPHACPK